MDTLTSATNRKERRVQVRRIGVMVLSVILALVVVAPIASGQTSSQGQPQGQWLEKLTAKWWNWAFATSPGPLEGSYTGGSQCNGKYVKRVFFLAGAVFDPDMPSVERNCTVPANKPILFPVVNVVCSAAFDPIQEPDDPKPYDTACAEPITDATIDPPSKFFATLDGKDLRQRRIASGLFQWTIAFEDNPFGVPTGTYEAASDGLWVFLRDGLKPGKHKIVFGGTYKDTPFGSFEGTTVTYKLRARR
jgi:hypothetical protein